MQALGRGHRAAAPEPARARRLHPRPLLADRRRGRHRARTPVRACSCGRSRPTRPRPLVQLPKGRGMYVGAVRPHRPAARRTRTPTGRVAVRDLRSGREVRLGGAPEDVFDARLSPDGTHVAAVTESGELLIWRVDRPARPERVLTGHRGHMNTVDYSPDGSGSSPPAPTAPCASGIRADGRRWCCAATRTRSTPRSSRTTGPACSARARTAPFDCGTPAAARRWRCCKSGDVPLYDVSLSPRRKDRDPRRERGRARLPVPGLRQPRQVRALARSRAPGAHARRSGSASSLPRADASRVAVGLSLQHPGSALRRRPRSPR